MNILLIGGGGFIGSYLGAFLLQNKHTVTVVDSDMRDNDTPDDEVVKISLFRRQELLKDAVGYQMPFKQWSASNSLAGFDVVVHLAALPLEKKDPAIERYQILHDIPHTFEIVEKMKAENPDGRIVYMSSQFAYGSYRWSATEDQPIKPETSYGLSKATGEAFVKMSGIKYNIIRTTSVYGFGDQHQRATKIFLNKALKGEEFWVNSSAWLDFIYVKDLANGLRAVIEGSAVNEDFHISGGMCLPLTEYVYRLTKYFPAMKYEVKSLNDRPGRGTMDNTKARMLLGWQPLYSLDTGVEEYVSLAKHYGFA